jgi:hypothetical protein
VSCSCLVSTSRAPALRDDGQRPSAPRDRPTQSLAPARPHPKLAQQDLVRVKPLPAEPSPKGIDSPVVTTAQSPSASARARSLVGLAPAQPSEPDELTDVTSLVHAKDGREVLADPVISVRQLPERASRSRSNKFARDGDGDFGSGACLSRACGPRVAFSG